MKLQLRNGRLFAIALAVLASSFIHAQNAPSPDQSAEQFYKNIQVFKGMPASELIPAMRFMAASLGVNCSHCHVTAGQQPWPMEKDDKKPKKTARDMILMTRAINKNNFDGKNEVTCATCHHGLEHPDAIPAIRPLGQPPRRMDHPASNAPSNPEAEQIVDRHLGLAGAAAAEKLRTRRIVGAWTGEPGRSFPLEIHQKAPDKYVASVALPPGPQRRGFDGANAWMTQQNQTTALTGLDLEQLRRAAEFVPAANVRRHYRVFVMAGRERIGEADAVAVEARADGKAAEKLFFDAASGLLVRRIVFHSTALGELPGQIDYADYKDFDGIKVPFTVRRTEPTARWTERYTEIQHNVPVDDEKFAKQ